MIVYICKNTLNNKVYIGITKRQTLDKRKYEHQYASLNPNKYKSIIFYNSIRKYGFDKFEWDILHECDTIEELYQKEEYYILKYDSTNREKGYNMLKSSTFFEYKHSQDFKDNLSKIKTDLKSKNPSSRYLGVVFIKSSNKWSSRITIDKKLIFISNSNSELEAAIQHDLYLVNNNINRKRNFSDIELDSLIKLHNIDYKIKSIDRTSKYIGVSFNNKSKRWNAQIWIKKPIHIGSYMNEDDAAIAYNRYVLDNNLNLDLNNIELKDIMKSKYLVKRGKYFGVSYRNSNNKFLAQIRHNGKTVFIGQYSTEIEAAKAYDEYLIRNNIDKSRNFPITERVSTFSNFLK